MEKSQDRIRFERLYLDSIGGFWYKYNVGSSGSVIHWLNVYTMMSIADSSIIGGGEVIFRNKKLANFLFDYELNIVIFHNIDDSIYPEFTRNQECYLRGLIEYKDFIEYANNLRDGIKSIFNR